MSAAMQAKGALATGQITGVAVLSAIVFSLSQ